MARNKTTIAVQITGDAKDLAREFQSAEQRAKGFRGVMTGVGAAVGAVIASDMIGKVVEFGKRMDEMATEAEQIGRRLDTTFGDMAGVAREWADENNEAFGVSEERLQEFLGSVQDTLIPLGFARDEAAGMTFEILELANALAEWKPGATSEQATAALVAALTGEREQLKSFGIVLKDTDIKARLAEKGLEGLTGEALKQATAQATLELATEGSRDALSAYGERTGSAIADTKELAANLADAEQAMSEFFSAEVGFVKGSIGEAAGDLALLADIVSGDKESSWLELLFGQGAWGSGSVDWIRDWARGVLEAKEAVEDVRSPLAEAATGMDEARHSARELDGKIRNMNGAFLEAGKFSSRFYEELEEDSLAAAKKHKEAVDDIESQMQELPGIFDEVGDEVELSFEEMMGNLNDLIEREARFNSGLRMLEALGLDDIAEQFRREGPKAVDALDDFLLQPLKDQIEAENLLEGMIDARDLEPAIQEALRAASGSQYRGLLLSIGDTWANWLVAGFNNSDWWDAMGVNVSATKESGGRVSVDATGTPIRAFHDGGVVPGPLGMEQLALVKGGETILPTHKTGVGVGATVNIYNPKTNDLNSDLQRALTAVRLLEVV